MLQGPSPDHLLGTDELGRDVLSRTIFAAQISMQVALFAVGVGLVGGTLIGVLAAYFGGWVDLVLMRLMELLFSFPAILLAVVLMASLGTNVLNAMIAIGIIFIPGFARLARASTNTVLRQQLHRGRPQHRHEPPPHHRRARSCRMSWRRCWSRPPSLSPTRCCSSPRSASWAWARSRRSRPGATC